MTHQHDHHSHQHSHDERHDHGHGQHSQHGHSHGVVDPSIATTDEGLWALKWSFVVLMATALLAAAIVFVSGSVGLLADTIHNFGDAATAIPLGIAFLFARKQPNKRLHSVMVGSRILQVWLSFLRSCLALLSRVMKASIGFFTRRISHTFGQSPLPRLSALSATKPSQFFGFELVVELAAPL